MRTTERLIKLQNWLYEKLCEGRAMKAPDPQMNVKNIHTQEPKCYLGWYPARPDQTEGNQSDELSVCPGILVMLNPSYGRNMEEKRFDRYNGVHRPQELGQTLSISLLFSIYEPGVRLKGFVKDGKVDMALIEEGTEQGLFTLYNWLDDCVELLLKEKYVPGTDMTVLEETIQYAPYTDQSYEVDKRPIYYGFVNVTFGCYASVGNGGQVDQLLK